MSTPASSVPARATAAGTVVRRPVVLDDPRWTQAHASTVCALPDGSLLAAWFAGSHEGAADTAVWAARREPAGRSWSPPEVLLDGPLPHWNPVLALGPDGTLWLFARRGPRISAWTTWVRTSPDLGRTWGEPRELVPGDRSGGRGPVRNPPLLLADGSWLAPGSVEVWEPEPRWDAVVAVSVDDGRTWQQAPVPLDHSGLRGAGVIQPALWSGADGVHALLRSSEGSAYRSSSHDGGRTWTPAVPSSLANNNSGLAVLALADGTVVCAHNPTTGDWGARCPLVLSVSPDDGLTWQQAVVVEDGVTPVDDDPAHRPALPTEGGLVPADVGVATSGAGEYSYPALAHVPDAVVVTYTWQRRGVVKAVVPLDLLVPSSPAPASAPGPGPGPSGPTPQPRPPHPGDPS